MTDYVSPNWERAALLVVDLQKDFLDDGVAAVPGTTAVVANVARLAQHFREAGRPVAHIVRLYEPGGSDVDLPRRDTIERGAEVVAPGSPGSQIPEAVTPPGVDLDPAALLTGGSQQLGEREVVFFKPRWSAFHRTRLESWLHEQGCDTVVVAGCNLPNCPRATLFDASERDFRAALVSDAVSQTSDERLADLQRIGVQVVTLATATTELAAIRPAPDDGTVRGR